MRKKIALITGITGQDGVYLVEFLLKKVTKSIELKEELFFSINTEKIDYLYKDFNEENVIFFLHYGDLMDSLNLTKLIKEIQPDKIYNLATQFHVAVSFDQSEYTANCDALGIFRILDAVRLLGLRDKTKIYQASTYKLFGKVQEILHNEKTPFYPRNLYAAAKLYAYWITVVYREAYGMFAFTVAIILEEFEKHIPEIYKKIVSKTFEEILENFETMSDISIDYAVMEKIERVEVLLRCGLLGYLLQCNAKG